MKSLIKAFVKSYHLAHLLISTSYADKYLPMSILVSTNTLDNSFLL